MVFGFTLPQHRGQNESDMFYSFYWQFEESETVLKRLMLCPASSLKAMLYENITIRWT